jgi:lipopolysaccharide biosynthesis glycosyltransferase
VRSVIVAWCKSNSTKFEEHVPLKFVGTRNFKLGFKTEIDILFLEGYKLIDYHYKEALRELGYRLHDTANIFSELERNYEALNQFGDYEKKCFLRWLVIKKYFPGDRIIHFDGDIVFNESPHILAEILNGKTFILQGCPALTVITDQNWFTQYEENLKLLVNDITGYSEQAWETRIKEKDAQKTWTGIRDRKIISSDQDLFRYLLHSHAIYTDKLDAIQNKLEKYIFLKTLYIWTFIIVI